MFSRNNVLDAVYSLIISAFFTYASYAAASYLVPDFDSNKVTSLEHWGVLFNFACVWSSARQNPWTWVYGAIAVILLGVVFWEGQLYSSFAMSVFYYLPIQFFGIYQWLYGGEQKTGVKITRTPWSEFLAMSVVTTVAIFGWGLVMTSYTNANFAFLDSAVFGLSIIAQYQIAKKRLECWPMWGVINVASVILYWNTGLHLLAIQYVLFFIHACYGTYLWTREYLADKRAAETEVDYAAA